MNIVVCIKQVPDTTEIKIDPVKNTLIRTGVPSIMNPFDKNALETGLQLKDRYGGKVTVISMGPPQAKAVLREALAMGADEAYLVTDRAFGGSDTYATSYILSQAIQMLGGFDVILGGKQAIDGDTAQVGPQIAEKLGIPQVTYVKNFELQDQSAIVERSLEDGYEKLKVKLPCVLTAIKELNVPRYMSVRGILRAAKTEVKVWNAADIGVDVETVGLKASPTNVFKSFTPKPKGVGVKIEGDTPKEKAANLLIALKEKHIILEEKSNEGF